MLHDPSVSVVNMYMYKEGDRYSSQEYMDQAVKAICGSNLSNENIFTVRLLLAVIISAIRERDYEYFNEEVRYKGRNTTIFAVHCNYLGVSEKFILKAINQYIYEGVVNKKYSKRSVEFYCQELFKLTGINGENRAKILLEEISHITDEELSNIPDTVKQYMGRYIEGASLYSIAKEYKVSTKTVTTGIRRFRNVCAKCLKNVTQDKTSPLLNR